MTYPPWARRTGATLNRNSPTILTGIAVGGVLATAILTARATKKVVVAMDDEVLTPKETVKAFWKDYIPPALSATATIACIIGANKIGLRRNAALAGAYAIADTALREYKDEVVKVLGKTKERAVDDEVARKQIEAHPVEDGQVIITAGGDVLCYERFTGRYFRSNPETLQRKANEFNKAILGGNMYGSLNEWYEAIGLGDADVGTVLGFNIDTLVELVFSSHLAQDGQPCLAVGFAFEPRPDYSKL